jgi:hypothetical protein
LQGGRGKGRGWGGDGGRIEALDTSLGALRTQAEHLREQLSVKDNEVGKGQQSNGTMVAKIEQVLNLLALLVQKYRY